MAEPLSARDCARAAEAIAQADGLIIAAGAGMGVDSGLPDFRGPEGFWRAYPALRASGLHFQDIANARAFAANPERAWGFYGHRLKLYRRTNPHEGFSILRQIAARLPMGAFVYTSNVDGHFQKAGFSEPRGCEVHGSIHYLQCLHGCLSETWSTEGFDPEIDEDNCLCLSALPRCEHCGGVARPNILMFDDWQWLPERTALQQQRFSRWRAGLKQPVVIEIGAGTSIPTIRRFSETQDSPLIRINPRDARIPTDGVGIAASALVALHMIESQLVARGFLKPIA